MVFLSFWFGYGIAYAIAAERITELCIQTALKVLDFENVTIKFDRELWEKGLLYLLKQSG